MTIEFQLPKGKIAGKLENFIRKEILKIAHINKEISRAEIMIKEDTTIPPANKVCEARLTVYGDVLFAYSRTESFDASVREVIKALKRLVKQQAKEQQLPPDKQVSTVRL